MKQQLRIAITGTSRSGKDTFAQAIQKKLVEMGFAEAMPIAFADPLKQLYKRYFFYMEDKEKPRDAYVTIGNAMREVDENVWINNLLIQAARDWDEGFSTLVTDVRFENEAKTLINDYGFILVKVDADPALFGNLIKHGADAASCSITDYMDVIVYGEHRFYSSPERGTVTGDGRVDAISVAGE